MKFENISTEEDAIAGRIRMAVLWEKEDVERFSDFFKQDMVDVVQIIGDDGVIGALVSPQLPGPLGSIDEERYRRMTESEIGVPELHEALDMSLNAIKCLKNQITSLHQELDKSRTELEWRRSLG